MHHLVDLWQVFEVDDLERRMNQASREEVDRLLAVLPVSDVRALDADHLEHRLEDGRLDLGARWQTDDDDGAPGSDVLGRLCEGLLVDGDEDDGVWAQAVLRRGADVLDDVGGLGEVDECLQS